MGRADELASANEGIQSLQEQTIETLHTEMKSLIDHYDELKQDLRSIGFAHGAYVAGNTATKQEMPRKLKNHLLVMKTVANTMQGTLNVLLAQLDRK